MMKGYGIDGSTVSNYQATYMIGGADTMANQYKSSRWMVYVINWQLGENT